jgi:hypothetical protein
MLTNYVCSVRQNVAGVPKRVFVDLLEEKASFQQNSLFLNPCLITILFQCSHDPCMQAKGSLNFDQSSQNFCQHIKKAREAAANKIIAIVETINLQQVLQKVSDEHLEEAFKSESTDDEITIYLLPGKIVAVPILNSEYSGNENSEFVHLNDLKCTLESCSTYKSKKHTLVVKGVSLCSHSLLGHLGQDKQPVETVKKDSKHYIDYQLTIRDVVSKIKKFFPSSYKDCEESDFIKNSRTFVDSLIAMPEKLEEVLKVVPRVCEHCGTSLVEWNYKEAVQYIIFTKCIRPDLYYKT